MNFVYGNTASKTKALVIDIGSIYVKCGFAGECTPRHVIRWELWKYLERTPKLSVDEWITLLSPFITSICFKYLQVKPKDKNIILCEDLVSSASLRQAIARIFFNHLKVSSIAFIPSPIASTFASGHHTALIIDAGWQASRVLPICKDVMLTHAYQSVPKGSLFVCNVIDSLLQGKARKDSMDDNNNASTTFPNGVTESERYKNLEDILVRCCFVKPLEANTTVASPMQYPYTSYKTIPISGELRGDAATELFCDIDDGNSVAEAVLESLLQCSILNRSSLLHNIVLIGGTSMIPGFKTRLMEQMKWETQNNPRYRPLKVLMEKSSVPRFAPLHFPPNLMAWIGASILGNLDTIPTTLISADQYQERGERVFDYFSVENLKMK